MATNYEATEITLEDYGPEAATLFLEVEYELTDYWPGQGFDPPEGELELKKLTVTRALVGCDGLEASPDQLKELQKQINNDLSAWHRVEEMVSAQIS